LKNIEEPIRSRLSAGCINRFYRPKSTSKDRFEDGGVVKIGGREIIRDLAMAICRVADARQIRAHYAEGEGRLKPVERRQHHSKR
jgi:hypothetical protein